MKKAFRVGLKPALNAFYELIRADDLLSLCLGNMIISGKIHYQ